MDHRFDFLPFFHSVVNFLSFLLSVLEKIDKSVLAGNRWNSFVSYVVSFLSLFYGKSNDRKWKSFVY